MIELKVEKGIIYFYDSIKNLPNSRKLLSDQCILWEDGIGTGLNKIRQNLMNAKSELLQKGNELNISTFIENADIGISALQYGEDYKLKDLVCYAESYQEDSKELEKVKELNFDNLEKYCKIFNDLGVTIWQVEEILEQIKKNSEEN